MSAALDLDQLSRLLAFSVISLYAIGLIAVNSYLFSLNVSDFALIRARFIYTGALIVIATAPPYFIASTLASDAVRHWKGAATRNRGTAILVVRRALAILMLVLFMMFLFFFYFIAFAAANDGAVRDASKDFQAALIPYLGGIGLATMAYVAVKRSIQRVASEEQPLRGYGEFVFPAIGMLFLAAIYLSYFMTVSYPRIPEQFGGGRPKTIQLLLKDDSVEGVRQLGLSTLPQQNLSEKVQLVYEGSDSYILKLSDGRVIRLEKSIVAGGIMKH